MVLPDSTVLECLIGYPWAQEFLYWDDSPPTVAHDFTGYDVVFRVNHQGGAVTTATVDVTGGSVLVTLTKAQTATFRAETAKYVIYKVNHTDPTDTFPLGAGYFSIKAV